MEMEGPQEEQHPTDVPTYSTKTKGPSLVEGEDTSTNVREVEGALEEHRPATDQPEPSTKKRSKPSATPPHRAENGKNSPSTKKSKLVPPPRQPAKDKPASSMKSKESKASLSHSSRPTATGKATSPNKKGTSSSVLASPHRSKTHKLASTPPSKKRRNDSEPSSSRHQKRART